MAEKKQPRVRKVETIRERNTRVIEAKPKQDRPSLVVRLLKVVFRPVGFVLRPLKIVGRFIIPRYFRNAYKELKLVEWPSRRQTWKLTFAVLIFATTFGFLVVLTDYGLDKVIRRIVLK